MEAKRAIDALDAQFDVTNSARAVGSAANDAWSAVAGAVEATRYRASSAMRDTGGGGGG